MKKVLLTLVIVGTLAFSFSSCAEENVEPNVGGQTESNPKAWD